MGFCDFLHNLLKQFLKVITKLSHLGVGFDLLAELLHVTAGRHPVKLNVQGRGVLLQKAMYTRVDGVLCHLQPWEGFGQIREDVKIPHSRMTNKC